MTTTEQTGRSLPTNYHHAWEMDGPNDVVLTAETLHELALAALAKGNAHTQLGRSMPAIGAYTSASRILETAADCVSQLQNMDLEPEPELLYTGQNRPNTLIARANALAQSLADANQNLMASLNQYKNAASVNPQQFYEQSGWYAMAQHRVLRSEWTAKAAEALEELRATGPAADPREIQRRTRLIYQVAIWPTDNDYKGVDYAVLQEPDPSLGAQARQADRNRNDRLAQILEPFNDDAPVKHSPAIAMCPGILGHIESMLVPPTGIIAGTAAVTPHPTTLAQQQAVETLTLTQDQEEDGDLHMSWMAFIHQGARCYKAVFEPYPNNYPANLAQTHISQLAITLRDIAENDPDHPGFNQFILSSMAAEGAAVQGLHTLTRHQVESLTEEAHNNGLTKAQSAEMLRRTAQDNSMALLYLSLNFGGHVRLEDTQAAASLIGSAQELGLQPETLIRMAIALGYRPKELGLTFQPADPFLQIQTARAVMPKGFPTHLVSLLPETQELPDTV